jgi:glycosyltransferase involved in cell wall biosynthesis
VLVIGTLDRGGAEGQLVALATGLDASRFDVRVCCLTAGGPLETPLRAAGLPVDVIGWQGFSRFEGLGMVWGPFGLARVVLQLRACFRRHRPHVVQGQLFWAYVIGAFAAALARVPVFVGCRRSLPLFKAANERYLWLERVASRLTTVVVANSEEVRAAAIRAEGLAPDLVVTIHNGVATHDGASREAAVAVRRALGLRDDDEAVICVANLIDYKGHRDLLTAWAQVRRARPSARLLLVGDGPERPAVEALGASLGHVHVLGSRADVPALLQASTLLVQASHQEGLPNAVLEAMAAGLPVVATAVGGTTELVVDGHTGRLVPPRDPDALAGALIALLADPGARARMGRAAVARASARFSLATMVSRYERLYDRLLAEV